MNTGKHENTPAEGNGMDTCSEAEDVKPRREEEETEDSVQCGDGSIKTEAEEVEDSEQYPDADREAETVPKEDAEGYTEDGLEKGVDDQRTEDEEKDEEEDEEGDTLNEEPQDLSLMDFSRYDSEDLPNTHHTAAAAAGGEGDYVSGVAEPRVQESSGKLSCDICGLSCVSINVLLVHKRSHTGERPFHCTQCGASFTQKGNLLRHIKLHSGEKPFKCPMCSYACRRRDALSGHLRTHSVEKPFKCNHCSRSYKQRSSLEEHRDRCHVFAQSRGAAEREEGQSSRTPMGSERALLLDRLASNVAKRKSSMPQKFTAKLELRAELLPHTCTNQGVVSIVLNSLQELCHRAAHSSSAQHQSDNGVCLDLSFNRETVQRADTKEPPPGSPGPASHHQPVLTGPDGDQAPPSHIRRYPIRSDAGAMGLINGHKMGMPLGGLPATAQPPRSMDPYHADSSPSVTYSLGHLLGGLSHQNGGPHPHAQPVPLSPAEALRAARADGDGGAPPGAVYPCGYCRVIFLDYVMFTIHMGCHGFRDPLECNVCGHRSRDRYEFSSHIARGEHRLEVK